MPVFYTSRGEEKASAINILGRSEEVKIGELQQEKHKEHKQN
jgi:hypothetical protein